MIVDWTQKIEKLACKSKLIYKITMKYYKNMVKKEVKLANINSGDNVLVVGGGACPHSGIIIHELTGANITVIDNEYKCVVCSRDLVKSLGYEKQIKILLEDGRTVDSSKYDVIHIALQIFPKIEVLNWFMKKTNRGTRILTRLPKKNVENLYSPLEAGIFKNLPKAVHGYFSNVKSTALIIKGGLYE